ncbi:hypothetical protein [Gottfriedia acidiceleris]|uniref:Uncharacterized protein n=1 Tax=Gottfriedia acidiceleris TaxID=371036 RepID=A0ABY4JPS0_9BACI|nr:hypothetical protein [Gottfriedia acidiceleris]UPM55846.1 hypothetical protein MY490_08465 [Gottfriedia acidiceleris]
MDAALGVFPIIIMLFYIAIPVGLIVVISYFYKLFKIRNEELKKQNELLSRIVNVLERA